MLLRFFYNLGLLAGLILALPPLLVKALRVPGYLAWIGGRLLAANRDRLPVAAAPGTGDCAGTGSRLPTVAVVPPAAASSAVGVAPAVGAGRPVIWLHALSVGEVLSARPLLAALRERYPAARLLLSSSTRSGLELARRRCAGLADKLMVMPLDLPWGAARLARHRHPDLFILVETDFWPNLLATLRRQGTALLLVNGRMTASSWRLHYHLRFLSRPLFFAPFSLLAMQSEAEAERLVRLGLDRERIVVPGNLKYAAALELVNCYRPSRRRKLGSGQGADGLGRPGRQAAVSPKATEQGREHLVSGCRLPQPLAGEDLRASKGRVRLWLAGSTHPGEEEMVLRVFAHLRPEFAELVLVLAPRRVERAATVEGLARCMGLAVENYRGRVGPEHRGKVLLVDRYGILGELYRSCELAFIGGSLVAAGGHNPLEAAVWRRPTIFGPHMDDFRAIADDLQQAGAARQVADEAELSGAVGHWLAAPAAGREAGERAGELVGRRGAGVIAAHLELVAGLLANGKGSAAVDGGPGAGAGAKGHREEKP